MSFIELKQGERYLVESVYEKDELIEIFVSEVSKSAYKIKFSETNVKWVYKGKFSEKYMIVELLNKISFPIL